MRFFALSLCGWQAVFGGLLLVARILGMGSLAFALDVPPYKGYVNDYADMISAGEEINLNGPCSPLT